MCFQFTCIIHTLATRPLFLVLKNCNSNFDSNALQTFGKCKTAGCRWWIIWYVLDSECLQHCTVVIVCISTVTACVIVGVWKACLVHWRCDDSRHSFVTESRSSSYPREMYLWSTSVCLMKRDACMMPCRRRENSSSASESLSAVLKSLRCC